MLNQFHHRERYKFDKRLSLKSANENSLLIHQRALTKFTASRRFEFIGIQIPYHRSLDSSLKILNSLKRVILNN